MHYWEGNREIPYNSVFDPPKCVIEWPLNHILPTRIPHQSWRLIFNSHSLFVMSEDNSTPSLKIHQPEHIRHFLINSSSQLSIFKVQTISRAPKTITFSLNSQVFSAHSSQPIQTKTSTSKPTKKKHHDIHHQPSTMTPTSPQPQAALHHWNLPPDPTLHHGVSGPSAASPPAGRRSRRCRQGPRCPPREPPTRRRPRESETRKRIWEWYLEMELLNWNPQLQIGKALVDDVQLIEIVNLVDLDVDLDDFDLHLEKLDLLDLAECSLDLLELDLKVVDLLVPHLSFPANLQRHIHDEAKVGAASFNIFKTQLKTFYSLENWYCWWFRHPAITTRDL